jgi:hypothetical protein
MPKFELLLAIVVEAADKSAAFADVRTHYCVVNDPENKVTENIVDFTIDDQIHDVIGYEDEEDEEVLA